MLRKLRGVLAIGLTWGVLWAAIGAVTALIIGATIPGSIDPGEDPLTMAGIIGLVGVFSGMAFGTVLSLAERRKTLLQLSPIRAAVWGIVGGAALPLLTTMNNELMFITCPLGAVFAAGSVAIARRGELRGSEHGKAGPPGT